MGKTCKKAKKNTKKAKGKIRRWSKEIKCYF